MRTDQIERLGQNRFRGDNRPRPSFQRGYTRGVKFLVSVDEGDEGAGIQQKLIDHGAACELDNRDDAGPYRAVR